MLSNTALSVARRARLPARHLTALTSVARRSTRVRSFSATTATAAPVYVVFGATGGIGSELTKQLRASGGNVVVTGRDQSKLDALVASAPGCHPVVADALQASQVDAVIADAIAKYGRIDGVTNCVGSILLKPAHLTSEQEFANIIATNLTTSFLITRAAVKVMSKASPPGGSIVLLSSVVANAGVSNHEAIAAAKAGVQGLALSAAASYSSAGIRVNCVAPGLTRTPMTARITGNENAMKASVEMHPLKRIGEAPELARAVAFLLSPENSWITGQVLGVDGGLGALRGK